MTVQNTKDDNWQEWAAAYANRKKSTFSDGADMLRYDSLKDDELNNYDPYSENASKIVPQYDDKLGFVASEGQKKAIYDFYVKNKKAVTAQKKALADYQTSYEASMADADKKAKGAIGQITEAGRKIGSQQKTKITVTDMFGMKRSYVVNRDWANKNISKFIDKSQGKYKEYKGKTHWVIYTGLYDKRFNDAMKGLEDQTKLADKQYDSAHKNVASILSAAQRQIASSRSSALRQHAFELERAKKVADYTRARWTSFIKTNRDRFNKAAITNAAGIKDLLDSGALTRKRS